jgi:xanthine dehydrogenase molybdopterin-binding subunit B
VALSFPYSHLSIQPHNNRAVLLLPQAHPWVPHGHLFTKGPGTYKIPTANDIPVDFRVTLLQNTPNPRAVHSSKVGSLTLLLRFLAWSFQDNTPASTSA